MKLIKERKLFHTAINKVMGNGLTTEKREMWEHRVYAIICHVSSNYVAVRVGVNETNHRLLAYCLLRF